MVIFLTSLLKTRDYSVDSARVPIALDDENGILTNLRKYITRKVSLVVVANDQNDAADNDDKLDCIYQSLAMSGIEFKTKTMLDCRNKVEAESIILGGDLVVLTGGKCLCQNSFFNELGLKQILQRYDGVVVGVSAGAMNLGRVIANFPEEIADLPEPRWLSGLGFADEIIIPHYDGEANKYQFECENFDIVGEYILPMSMGKSFVGLPNGSYIIIDRDGAKRYCGDVYSIKNGVCKKM